MEENGGDDGNSSVAELEVRVEALEGTTGDHETRISDIEADVNGNHDDLIVQKKDICCYLKIFHCVKLHFRFRRISR